MIQETRLYQTLCGLFEFCSGKKPDADVRSQIFETLNHNDFERDSQSPDWLLEFFSAIINKIPITAKSYGGYNPGDGDVVNLLAELEDIMPADWENEGELLTVTFHSGSVISFVMFVDYYYEVRVYPQVG